MLIFPNYQETERLMRDDWLSNLFNATLLIYLCGCMEIRERKSILGACFIFWILFSGGLFSVSWKIRIHRRESGELQRIEFDEFYRWILIRRYVFFREIHLRSCNPFNKLTGIRGEFCQMDFRGSCFSRNCKLLKVDSLSGLRIHIRESIAKNQKIGNKP